MLRRHLFAATLAATAVRPAFGQAWPGKPITLIVPFRRRRADRPAGAHPGRAHGKELGQQFIIENVTGAAGTIAMARLARSAPDGYTIGIIGHVGTNVANAVIYTKLGSTSRRTPCRRSRPQSPLWSCRTPPCASVWELGMDTPTVEEMKPAAFAVFQKAEYARWKPILEAAGVKAE